MHRKNTLTIKTSLLKVLAVAVTLIFTSRPAFASFSDAGGAAFSVADATSAELAMGLPIPNPKALVSQSGTDYSAAENWLSFGGGGGDGANSADVFLIYPMGAYSTDLADRPFMRLDSEIMGFMTRDWLDLVEGIFEGSANIYAPYYRQINAAEVQYLDTYSFSALVNSVPLADIFAAFDYYLKNVNRGERPFILFGHSQGALLCVELATVFLGSADYAAYNANHVVTYAPGFSTTEDQLARNPAVRFSESPVDTGVITSWNTVAPSEIASGAYRNFITWKPDALTTNPISWVPAETLAHASENGASYLKTPSGEPQAVAAYANAIVDNEHGVLVPTTVDESDYTTTSDKIGKFHQGDIRFYYESIKQNIKDRLWAHSQK